MKLLLSIIATLLVASLFYIQTNDFKLRLKKRSLSNQEQSLMIPVSDSKKNVEVLVIQLTSTAIALWKEITILNTADQKLKSVQQELDNITKLNDLAHRAITN